jgi:hypothetical protein
MYTLARKKTRLEVFKAAVEEFPALFELTDNGTAFKRLDIDVKKLEAILDRSGVDEFGSFSSWLTVWDARRELRAQFGDAETAMDHDADLEYAVGDVACGFLDEVVNLRALRKYARSERVRDRGVVEQYIRRCETEGTLVGDYATVRVSYYRKYGLPGRKYARGPALQKCERGARDAAQDSLIQSHDIRNAMPTLFLALVREKLPDVAQRLLMWPLYDKCYCEWRAVVAEYAGVPLDEAKQTFSAIFSLGLPMYDLPFLWTLACEVSAATTALLSLPDYRHLNDFFGDRRNPRASRLHYALAASEDACIARLEVAITEHFPETSRIQAYIFDDILISVGVKDACGSNTIAALIGLELGVRFNAKGFPTSPPLARVVQNSSPGWQTEIPLQAQGFDDACLYAACYALVADRQCIASGNGPFSSRAFNEHAYHDSQRSADVLFLEHCPDVSRESMHQQSLDFVAYQRMADGGHFFAVRFRDDGAVHLLDTLAQFGIHDMLT